MKNFLNVFFLTTFILGLFLTFKNNIYSQTTSNIYHHKIHGFYSNYDWEQNEDYAFEHKHALQMGYSLVPIGKPEEGEYNNLGIIKNHQAALAPIRFQLFDADGDGVEEIKQFKYFGRYHGEYDGAAGKYRSIFDNSKYVETQYPISEDIINFIKSYACAKPGADLSQLTAETIDYDLMNNLFHFVWEKSDGSFNVRANFPSKYVVNNLVEKTIETLNYEEVDGIFFDYFNVGVDNCSNAEYNGPEIYNDWYEGQREFISQIQNQVKQMQNVHENPYFVLANVGNPKIYGGARAAEYYAQDLLRLDHYIFEMTTIRDLDTREIILAQDANSTDPETGKPAFIPIDYQTGVPLHDSPSDAFIPADRVSLNPGVNKMVGSGSEGWYAKEGIVNHPYREDDYFNDTQCELHPNDDDWFTQHLKTCGIAGKQGSWFGYNVGTGVGSKDIYKCVSGKPEYKLEEEKDWVFANDLQLLRSLPDWDNLLEVPLSDRKWNEDVMVYQSTNSYASPEVIYSRHFQTGELFVVFKSLNGEVVLQPEERVASAEFADRYFARNGEDALPCLAVEGDTLKLKSFCHSKLGNGIRISNQPSRQRIISWWDFNENSGTTVHDSAGKNNGVINGATWISGIDGSGLSFDGIDDHVTMGDKNDFDFFDGDDFSISAWIKRSGGLGENNVIISKRNAFTDLSKGYALQISAENKLVFEICDKVTSNDTDSYNLTSSLVINDNDWHHVVVVFDDSGEKNGLFIDGIKDTSVTKTGNINDIYHLANNKNFVIGALACLKRPFNGVIDEVRVFDEVLSASEVEELYNQIVPGKLGDLNGDGVVDIFDYNILISNFGGSGEGDLDDDGDVDIFDYNILISNFGS